MWLTSVAIAGTLGAGVKVYRDKKREREKPWTVAAERMQPFDRLRAPLSPLFKPPRRKKGAQKMMESFKRRHPSRSGLSVSDILSDTRQEQLKEISATGEIEVSEVEKKNNQHFAIALSSLGLTSAGGLFYAPLSWLALPGLLYLTTQVVGRSYRCIFSEGRAGGAIVDIISIGGILVTGHLFAAALHHSLYFFRYKLLLKTEDQTNQNL